MNTLEVKKKRLSDEPITQLAQEAAVGFFVSTYNLIEYVFLWYFCYPILFFGSLYIIQLFLTGNVEYASLEFFFHVFLAGIAAIYFGIKLVNKCVVLQRLSREYIVQTPEIWVDMFLYLAVNVFSFARLGIPIYAKIMANREVAFDLKLFMAIYLASLLAIKYYYKKYFIDR